MLNFKNMSVPAIGEKFFKLFDKPSCLSLLLTFYATTAATLLFFPKQHWHISEFNKIIGMAAINDYDIGKLVANFYAYFIVIAIVFVLSIMLARRVEEKLITVGSNRVEQLMMLSALGVALNFMQFIGIGAGRLSLGTVFYIMVFTAFLATTFRQWSKEDTVRLLIASVSLCIPLGLIISKVINKAQIAYPLALLLALIVGWILVSFKREQLSRNLFSLCLILPLITFAFIELVHISAQQSLIFGNPYRNYLIVFCVAIVSICVMPRKFRIDIPLGKAVIVGLLGISLLMSQSGYYFVGNADLFESANYSVLISDFFNFGTLPIVSHFGGHMLSGVLEGILYGAITGDHYGAIFSSGYHGYLIAPCLTLLLYGLFRRLFDDVLIAFLSVTFFPFSGILWNYGLGLAIVLTVARFSVENTWKATSWLLLAIIACCLYRLDLGYSFALAAVLISVWLILIRQKKIDWRNVGLPILVIIVLSIILWGLLCWQQGSNPILRLREFLAICASNPNWAYSSLGDKSLFAYGWAYLVMPCICVVSLVWLLANRENYQPRVLFVTVAVAVLGVAYFTNFTRGLVRHSILEVNLNCTLWSGYLFLACFIGIVSKKKWLTLPVLLVFCMTNGLLKNNGSYGIWPMIQNSAVNNFNITRSWIDKEPNGQTFMKNLQTGKHSLTRLKINNTVAAETDTWKQFLDKMLASDETYLDFTNQSFMYSATGRRDPVYAAQSPAHLSGDFSQEMFVRDVKRQRAKIPLAFMPSKDGNLSASLDGVANVIRYYKVVEYIYQNYRPLVAMKDYRIWVLNERYEEFAKKIFNNEQSKLNTREVLPNLILDQPKCVNCNLYAKDGQLVVVGMTNDPILDNIQSQLNLNDFEGRRIRISIRYKSSKPGFAQLFYANNINGNYAENRSLRCDNGYTGEITFNLPIKVTKFTKLRLDTPAYSVFEIDSIQVSESREIARIDYGYDQDNSVFHNYYVNHLPRVWGDFGEVGSDGCALKVKCSGYECKFIGPVPFDKSSGNYVVLKIDAQQSGSGNETNLIALGIGGKERYKYAFTLAKGLHTYVFRVSSDYWWYADNIQFRIISKNKFKIIDSYIRKGD